MIDVNLLESMLQMMSALPSAAAHLDYEQPRLGSGIPYSVPRGTYRCADGQWVAISTSAESVAHRVLELARRRRRPALRDRSRGRAGAPRGARPRSSARGSARVRRPRCSPRSKRREAAIAPVYTMRDLLADPHVRGARGVRRGRRRRDARPDRAVVADAGARPSRGPAARRRRRPDAHLGAPAVTAIIPRRAGRETPQRSPRDD